MTKLTTARASEILGEDIVAGTAVARFIADDIAQDAIIELVDVLFDVAEENGAPRTWANISCDGSLNSSLEEVGFDELYEDDYDFRAVLDQHLEDLTGATFDSRLESARDAVKDAKDLFALRLALEEADEFVKKYDLGLTSVYEPTELKTFGGLEIDGAGIYSFDEKNVLWGLGGWSISPRDAETGETVEQDSCAFDIDGIEYRSDDRFLLGADKIDTIRFVRWKPQDAVSSVRDGEVLIRAFERDRVLLSELIERVKATEAEDAIEFA